MLIRYIDLYGETPKVPCTPEIIEEYLETAAGKGAAMTPLANRLRLLAAPEE
jgi:hypothetical protein